MSSFNEDLNDFAEIITMISVNITILLVLTSPLWIAILIYMEVIILH